MKLKRPLKILFFLFAALLALACTCNGGALLATATPVPTNTPAVTNTPPPTKTPESTETPVPEIPTPAPMGTTVSNEDYEVNVLYMRTLETVYLDAQYQWVPTAGNMFVELGIKVVNLKPGSQVSIPWGDINILLVGVGDEDAGPWYPNWGEFKSTESGVDFNPKKLVFRTLEDPEELVVFDETAYIRAIYGAKKLTPTTIHFGFGDSPLIEVVVP